MSRISLDGDWKLVFLPEGERAIAHPDDLAEGDSPIPARVPGNVELDLLRARMIPEPFYGANMRLLRPFEFCEWWYMRDFTIPDPPGPETWDLVFAGLDTFATVWVNGVEVGRSDNMFIEHRFDATAAVRRGHVNRIAIRIASPVNRARGFHYDAAGMSWEQREEGLFIRKAAHMWGWDIMPRAVSAGIWRSVWLEIRPPTAIEQLYYWTVDAASDPAVLQARWQFRTDAPDLDGFAFRFHGECGGHKFDFEWPAEFVAGGCRIPVPGARLWWPKGYGEPSLYDVTAQLLHKGRVVAERTDRIGIRKLVVDRTATAGAATSLESAKQDAVRVDAPPDPASHFVFYVNDEPIMVKGSSWVPLDAFHSRDAERVERAVALFDDLGCNMIRCWGGNVYEDHRFFDLCDEKGILVWQDLAFACCRYPQTEEFLGRVRTEIEAVAEKLRNHACLALWCGDNEVDTAYASDGLSPEHNRITREIIPQVLYRCDPHRAYVPSSPYVPPALKSERDVWVLTPEQHLWGPRGYYKAPFYRRHSAHFIGEIGYHGCPNVSSIRRFISPEHLWPWHEVDGQRADDEWNLHSSYHWQHRAIDRDRIRLMANQVGHLFGEVPADIDSFALASQITQAEAKKFFIESTRLRKWRTSGILWWNVIDGWPQFSDAIVDYYFGKKLAYQYIRRVQRPICVIMGEPDSEGNLPVVVANDSRREAQVHFRVQAADNDAVLAEGTCASPANQNWQVARIGNPGNSRQLYLILWEADGVKHGSHYLAGPPPFSLAQYRSWLPRIAALPAPFDASAVAR